MSQVRDIERLAASCDVEILHVEVHELQHALLPSPLRCLAALKELFPRLAHEKCDAFLAFTRAACVRIQKPIVPALDAFATYLLNLKVR